MGDVLVTSDMSVVRLPDLAWIADTHPLASMKEHKVPGGTFGTVASHSSKLYFNSSWPAGQKWRVYFSRFNPTPATLQVSYAADPTSGTWTTTPLTVPALAAYEDTGYGIGSLALVKTPGMVGSTWKAFYQYRNATTGHYETGRMDTADGLTFTNKQLVTFDSALDGYDVRGITSAIYDEVQQKIIATAHVSASGERLYGAILESTDGLAFTTTSLMIDPGLDRHSTIAGDFFDLHWIEKIGSVYCILWTTSRNTDHSQIQTGIGVSVNLTDWYIPPRLAWPYDATNTPLRYPSSTYVDGHHYVVGVNTSTDGIDVIDVPPT